MNSRGENLALRIMSVAAVMLACVAGGLANATEESSCGSQQGMDFVCGPVNGEDLVWLPATDQIVVSGMSDEGAGHIYLLNAATRSYREWFPGPEPSMRWDRMTFAACPGPLNVRNFSAHGLSMLAGESQVHRLYVTSHGEREAVEVFEIDASGAQPSIAWIGCVPIPAHNDINSVAALSDGGFITTRISGTGPQAGGDIFAGEISGFLYEWHPGGELLRIPGTEMSGPNGIIVSADQKLVYVGSWGASAVVRFVRDEDGNLRRDGRVDTGFRVDNLRWTPSGTMLAAGHRMSAQTDCGLPLCFDDWEVAEIDQRLSQVTTRVVKRPLPGFTGATVALLDRASAGYWLGTFHGDRLVYIGSD